MDNVQRNKMQKSKYRLDDWGSIPGGGKKIFPLASVSRQLLRPTLPPIQWVPAVFSPEVKCVTLTTTHAI
jgi:hypothetical protein